MHSWLIPWPRLQRILKIAVPIILGMVSQNLLNLVDTAFVGRLGDASLAAVGMGGFANWLLVSFLLGLGSGVQATAARRLGEGKTGEMAIGLNSALLISLAFGIPVAVLGVYFASDIFTLLNDDPEVVTLGAGYLVARFLGTPFSAANVSFRGFWNGTNRSIYYLLSLVVMHVTNVVLDYGLIFGNLGLPELGVQGAGYATSISVITGTMMYFFMGMRKARHEGFLRLKGLWEVMPTIARLSVPAGLQNFLLSAGFVVFFVIAGKVGTSTLAASNVLINLALVCILPGMGFGLAGASLVGQAMGAGDLADAKRWGWEVVRLGAALMGLLGFSLAIGNRFWLGLFIVDNPETLELAVWPLIVLGSGQIIDAIGIVLLNVMVGIGDTMAVLRINLICQWVIFLPLAWLFAVELEYGIIALWVGMVGYRTLLAIAMSWRFRNGQWTRARA